MCVVFERKASNNVKLGEIPIQALMCNTIAPSSTRAIPPTLMDVLYKLHQPYSSSCQPNHVVLIVKNRSTGCWCWGEHKALVLFAPTLFLLEFLDVLVEFVEMLSVLRELFFELFEAVGVEIESQLTE
jgi:hypothetical protein